MPIEAIIFDMDDLMIDSEPLHLKTIEEVLKEQSSSVSFFSGQNPLAPAERASFFGLKITEVISRLRDKYSVDSSLDELNRRYNELLLSGLPSLVKPMPGLYELIKSLQTQGYKLALASSSSRKKIDIVLEALKLVDAFNPGWIVSGEDEIKHGKPAPDIFLKAAQKLGLEPSKCLVLEDAMYGVEAAKSAGMYCIGVHNQYSFERLSIRQDLGKADLQVNGLGNVSLAYVASLP